MSILLLAFLKLIPSTILPAVLNYFEKKNNAEADKYAKTVELEIVRREIHRDILLAEQDWWVTRLIRPAFAYPLIVWWIAVIADSLFLWEWNVAALPAPLDEWSGWIVSAFFIGRSGEKIAGKVAGIFKK